MSEPTPIRGEARRREFQQQGTTIMEDALPLTVAESARALYQTAEYDHIHQERKHHYEHVFRTTSPYLPEPGEVYVASFWRSRWLENNPTVSGLYTNHIKPMLEDLAGFKSEKVDLRAYKMTEGDQFRVHIDDYLGPVGFIYYLSKNWKWDWGGILMTVEGEVMTPALPKFNQLVVLNHGKTRPPHLVTPVASFAREPRYMLLGFMG
jgi:Rps23 Pro-64 3,4-dihydroxylase Tpa1-like proline 4-hydroxylase